MSRATPQMRIFAKRLIAHAAKGNKSCATKNPAAFPVCETLRPHLATLIGNTGVRMLLSRALAQAEGEVPSLCSLQVKADGSLEHSGEPKVQADPEELAEGSVILIAQLFGLLVAFIGQTLVLQIVSDAWPHLAPDDLKSLKRDET